MKTIFKTITIMLVSIALSNTIIGCASTPKDSYNPSLGDIFSANLPLIKDNGGQNLSIEPYYEPGIKTGFQIKNLELGTFESFSKEDLDLYNSVTSFTSSKKYGVRITDQSFLQLLTNEISSKRENSALEKFAFERYKNNYVLCVFEDHVDAKSGLSMDYATILYNGSFIDVVYFADDKPIVYALAQYGIIVK